MSDGGSTCWCVGVVISPRVLRAIPGVLRNEACLCKACAAGAAVRAECGLTPENNRDDNHALR
jgi:Cysteine-rich CWC